MTAKHRKRSRGVTLVELIVAAAVMCVAALGALSYEYLAAGHARVAKAQSAAVQIAYFLLQDWKSNGGSIHYRFSGPSELNNVVEWDTDFVEVGEGVYRARIDDIPLQIELSRPDEYRLLIPITVTVRWRLDFADGEIRSDDPSLVLTTYARAGQSSG